MRISDWSSDVCSSDLDLQHQREPGEHAEIPEIVQVARHGIARADSIVDETGKRQALIDPAHQRVLRLVMFSPGEAHCSIPQPIRSEEHTSELQSLMRISYAVFCLKKKKNHNNKVKELMFKT